MIWLGGRREAAATCRPITVQDTKGVGSSGVKYQAIIWVYYQSARGEINFDGKAVAAQDFRHIAGETVSEFVSILENTFRKAYSHEGQREQ